MQSVCLHISLMIMDYKRDLLTRIKLITQNAEKYNRYLTWQIISNSWHHEKNHATSTILRLFSFKLITGTVLLQFCGQ
jgi:hypothetical protein